MAETEDRSSKICRGQELSGSSDKRNRNHSLDFAQLTSSPNLGVSSLCRTSTQASSAECQHLPPCRCLHVSPPRLLGFGSMEICRCIYETICSQVEPAISDCSLPAHSLSPDLCNLYLTFTIVIISALSCSISTTPTSSEESTLDPTISCWAPFPSLFFTFPTSTVLTRAKLRTGR